jgi:NADP-dependent 3-hydroxy acid dehydrogenase YdfG
VRVALSGRREDRLREVARDLPDETLLAPADLRHEADIDAGFAKIRAQWGGVDIMINNAGLGYFSPLMSGDTAQWREMLEVNVLALCICTRAAVRDMQTRGDDGHVVHIGSMAGHRVPQNSGVYSATKFAVRSLTEGLRQELREQKSKIRVSCISPGIVQTGFHANFHTSEEAARDYYGRFQVLQPEDVADAVAFVLAAPTHVQVHDLLLRPRDQPS